MVLLFLTLPCSGAAEAPDAVCGPEQASGEQGELVCIPQFPKKPWPGPQIVEATDAGC